MGSLLEKPKTEFIEEDDGETDSCHWGVSSMQGWRMEMEVSENVEQL